MLIKVKNPELYKAWLKYYKNNTLYSPAEKRTYSFIYSTEGKYPPC